MFASRKCLYTSALVDPCKMQSAQFTTACSCILSLAQVIHLWVSKHLPCKLMSLKQACKCAQSSICPPMPLSSHPTHTGALAGQSVHARPHPCAHLRACSLLLPFTHPPSYKCAKKYSAQHTHIHTHTHTQTHTHTRTACRLKDAPVIDDGKSSGRWSPDF